MSRDAAGELYIGRWNDVASFNILSYIMFSSLYLCRWGRGVIQTTGICNFGKLNYFLGARAAKEGRSTPYADIDFCKVS